MTRSLPQRNLTDGCALPKVEHKEMHTLSADQLSAFLREAKESGVYEMYYFELATGIRRGELLGLDEYTIWAVCLLPPNDCKKL